MNRRSLLFAGAALVVTMPTACSAKPSGLVSLTKGLDHPWGLAFLPDGSALITERPGRLRRFVFADFTLSKPIIGTPEVDANGQGGLLGIAIDPDFARNRTLYLSFAERQDNGNVTAVFRARLSADHAALEDGKVIFRQNMVAESHQHFGSRLVFDPSGHLFVTTGDRGYLKAQAQNPASHVGKVLRITKDGAPAPGNPNLVGWAPEVWSIGHRNVQGATLHPETGQLWTVEHGARGGDEVNTPAAGENHGWPVITYGRDYSGAKIGEGTAKEGMVQPLHYWDPSIAPSGMAFLSSDSYPNWKGNLFVGALAGKHIARLVIHDGKVTEEEKLFEGFARFRDIVQGPDGLIYALTDEGGPDGGLFVIAAPEDVTSTTGKSKSP